MQNRNIIITTILLAFGFFALLRNTAGNYNTAIGFQALSVNTTGSANTATGVSALLDNTDGEHNTAMGFEALLTNTSGDNTAVGSQALGSTTSGGNNTAVGSAAGSNQTTGSNNVYIGAGINGIAGENDTCRIKSIFGQTAVNGSAVFITSGNKLGTNTSSKRFKEAIKPMDKASEALFSLTPVTFRYKKEIDPAGTQQFGLVAEDVEKINPDLVVRDENGKVNSVRYEHINAMLLNQFLKEHRKVEKLEATLMHQQKSFQSRLAEQEIQIEALASGLQKVNAQLQLGKKAPQMAVNGP